MPDTTELEQRLAAARPGVDDGEQRLAAMVASRLFGPAHAQPARIGRFTLLERIGRGGMGDVYAAYDPALDRKVALKLLRGDAGVAAAGSLLREARAAARLAHPNVVAIHDVGELDGAVYVAMEFIAGVTLRAWLRDRPPLDAVLRVFVDAGRGLAAAHDAGVVHGDFKPENLLVSRDGGESRGRVVDFGLARVAARPSPAPADDPGPPDAGMGTPAYMSPEQFMRRPVDGRGDQFAFCVALHEALAGRHPFGADEPGVGAEQLRARVVAGEAPRGERSIPAWLRTIVRRGLLADPAARHPSMHALVRELQATPARRRRRALLVAGAALAVASSTLTLAGRDLTASPCEDIDDELQGVWDAPLRAASRAAFLATGLTDADDVWQRIVPRVDEYARAWVGERRRTCEALHADPTAPRDALRLRDACLGRRRVELRSLAALLLAPGRSTLDAAIAAAEHLTPIAACDDVDGLRREVPRGDPIRELLAVEALRREILDMITRVRAGDVDRVAPRVAMLTTAARERGGATVLAEALLLRGLVEEARGDHDAAATSLEAAVHEAIAGRHDRLHAEVAVHLVWLHGVQRRRHDLATTWVGHAAAALRAIRDDAPLRARLLDHRGSLASLAHDAPAAEHLYREALALRSGAGLHSDLAASMSNLGLALLSQGRLAEAEPMIEAALARYREALGPHHPTVAAVLSNLGHAHMTAGRHDRGLALLHEALALKERTLGREHLALLNTLNNLGSAYSELGRSAEARAHYLRALAIGERALGPDHPRLESLLHNLAFEAWATGAHDEVARHAGRALAIQRRVHGDAHPILAPTLELLARSALELGRRDDAAATIDRALALSAGSTLEPAVRGAIVLSAAWIGRATGSDPATVRRLALDARSLLGPGADPDQQRELADLLGP